MNRSKCFNSSRVYFIFHNYSYKIIIDVAQITPPSTFTTIFIANEKLLQLQLTIDTEIINVQTLNLPKNSTYQSNLTRRMGNIIEY